MRLQDMPDDGYLEGMIPNKCLDSGMHSRVHTSHGAR